MFEEKKKVNKEYRPWQTRTHCCGHIVADTNVSPFARARNICCGNKFCVRDTKNVSDFVQKHCVRNKCFPVCAAQETSWATMCLQQRVLVYQGLKQGFRDSLLEHTVFTRFNNFAVNFPLDGLSSFKNTNDSQSLPSKRTD